MTGTRTPFSGEVAPCGKRGDGEHFLDDDGHGLLIRDQHFACGCRRMRHEYHDGSIHVSALRCDGRRVKETDQVDPDHGC
ncbi:hypothetical protein HNP84_000944 [Thermocatellispora tengchongensis]|uniref:Uncharacterized protein n=1 Tax=Thermocatellispora tengchongensis TaxID=1073253 RepID=A0A840NUK6_9ACTN|nr:hypothetical protein [Thermocatellispora tengchongensis]MBB5131238.1 hypothetical protein [Thermocatellispora tengchongensis]